MTSAVSVEELSEDQWPRYRDIRIAAGNRRAAVEPLRKLLAEDDLWLRIRAADALAAIDAAVLLARPKAWR